MQKNAPTEDERILVEITDPTEHHCFRLVFNPSSDPGQRIEIMLHARSLVDLIHKCSVALSDWQLEGTDRLLALLDKYPRVAKP